MLVMKACKYTPDEVRGIRSQYNRVRLLQNQMGMIRDEIRRRERKLSEMRLEIKEIKHEIIEEFNVSQSTMVNIGNGYSRRDVR